MANTETAAMALLRANLGYSAGTVPTDVSLLMSNDLATAEADLARAGIDIDQTDAADLNLLVMFAAWLYRKRVTGEARPAMLKIEINDRKVAKATASPSPADDGEDGEDAGNGEAGT